jgi:hypothetical protein
LVQSVLLRNPGRLRLAVARRWWDYWLMDIYTPIMDGAMRRASVEKGELPSAASDDNGVGE